MERPNLLVICVDHWCARMLGAAGHPTILTPTLDRFCRNGIRFTNAYSSTPTCIPARRAIMTGTTAKTHGDRIFNETLLMPSIPTLAGTLAQGGYQCNAVGKLHVYPQRDRIGFHDVILNEEGRHHLGMKADDYELFLAEEGYAGQELTHGMCNNDYMTRPWHLPEYLHPTNWTVKEMCRTIKRRDPKRLGFWYMSFNHPHPPLAPLRDYIDMYRDVPIDEPFVGSWANEMETMPYALRVMRDRYSGISPHALMTARRAFYALCTHIDHQMRLVIGLLREEGLINNTAVLFISDHGDMLGNHHLFAKGNCLDEAAKVPMILVLPEGQTDGRYDITDDRLVELRDVMPTLLDIAGVPIPDTVEGNSLLSDERRDSIYLEHYENERATRSVRDPRYKLIYYPVGNVVHLFDLREDPHEMNNLADDKEHQDIRGRLTATLITEMYGRDEQWVQGDQLIGEPDRPYQPSPDRTLIAQRGWRFMGDGCRPIV